MEKSNADCEAIADANFIGWGRWAAKQLLFSLAPKTGTHAPRSAYPQHIDTAAEPAEHPHPPPEYRA